MKLPWRKKKSDEDKEVNIDMLEDEVKAFLLKEMIKWKNKYDNNKTEMFG